MPTSICLVLALTTWLTAPVPSEKKTITAAEARAHLGESVTICGKVVSIQKATAARAGKTWQMHIDQTAPPIFTLIANASTFDNPFFSNADARFSGKDVCVEGQVKEHNGMVYIRLTEPRQIRIVKDKN
jgi:DNA/RNA endonuclease YhcR with UshA esterase domain